MYGLVRDVEDENPDLLAEKAEAGELVGEDHLETAEGGPQDVEDYKAGGGVDETKGDVAEEGGDDGGDCSRSWSLGWGW